MFINTQLFSQDTKAWTFQTVNIKVRLTSVLGVMQYYDVKCLEKKETKKTFDMSSWCHVLENSEAPIRPLTAAVRRWKTLHVSPVVWSMPAGPMRGTYLQSSTLEASG